MDLKKTFASKNGLFMELVRFVIIGLYVTLIDLANEGWFTSMVSSMTASMNHIVSFFVMFVISVIGFLVATPATWSLTTIWGFRNVEENAEKKARSLNGALKFTFLAFIGLLVGAVIQFFGYMICLEWSGLGINILNGFSFDVMFNQGHPEIFWAWFVVIFIRTVFTTIFNYVTRKLFIYKAPRKEDKE